MSLSPLIIHREDRVLRLTLNHPDRHNVLDDQLCEELAAALDDAGHEQNIGCILLDAAGPVFCAGMEVDALMRPEAQEIIEVHEHLFSLGIHYHKPVVAAVQGPALGAGLALLANCHVVIAAQGATFGLTEIRFGYWPYVTHRSLAMAIGERRTVELSLTGRIFSTTDALQYGLVHEVAPAFELDDRATATAQLLANASQEALRRGLDFVQKSRTMTWESAGALAAEYSERTFHSADFAEGVRAYRGKRKPDWPSLK